MSTLTDNRRIIFLDYLRIFAFVSVLLGHKFYAQLVALQQNATIHATPKFLINMLLPVLQGGGAGVVVFFLVSGYIITHVLRSESAFEFAIKRTFRIYPLYIFAVSLQVLFTYIENGSLPYTNILIPQLLLIGDFFNTPHSLAGVEWTLRVEILFYVFMGTLKIFNLLDKYKNTLPFLFAICVLLLGWFAPFPSSMLNIGYFTLYSPFLLLGATIYLKEKGDVNLSNLMLLTIIIFSQHFYLMPIYHPIWIGAHFAILAFIIFLFTWLMRFHLRSNWLILLFSDLTYSVYIFHNWMWGYITNMVNTFKISMVPIEFQTLFLLLLFCFIMHKTIERSGIQLGRMLLKFIHYKKYEPTTQPT